MFMQTCTIWHEYMVRACSDALTTQTNFKKFSLVTMLPLCQLAEFECYYLISSWPQAMDDKALTHFLSVTAFSAVPQCALWIISHMALQHSEVPKKQLRESWSHDKEVAFPQYLVEQWLEVTQSCFKPATLTAAVNSLSHLHVKGPVKNKSNTANKWNAVSFLLFDYLWLSMIICGLSTYTKYSGRLHTKLGKSTSLWPPVGPGTILKVQTSRMVTLYLKPSGKGIWNHQ